MGQASNNLALRSPMGLLRGNWKGPTSPRVCLKRTAASAAVMPEQPAKLELLRVAAHGWAGQRAIGGGLSVGDGAGGDSQ